MTGASVPRPYPVKWERTLVLRDGSRIYVRPIRPDDEPQIKWLLEHTSGRDLRFRFFTTVKVFTHEFLAALTNLDYSRAMAFVAFDESGKEILGVVRLHSDDGHQSGEFAILLRSDSRGRGLGWAMMNLMIEYGRSEGLKQITGQVLCENRPMLAMCRELGFQIHVNPEERDVYEATLTLEDQPAA
ncbi:MAG: N-acetyltransferase [Bradyrhizobiaceae bacterium]|nr:MAG: N-acetyltransferase [Bradyrhizobiaceae bacterium]